MAASYTVELVGEDDKKAPEAEEFAPGPRCDSCKAIAYSRHTLDEDGVRLVCLACWTKERQQRALG